MSNFKSMIRSSFLFLLSLAAVGCAAGGSGNGGGSSFVRMDMGNNTIQNFQEQTTDLLRRQSFQIFRQDPAPAPLIESEWRNQTPTEDERALGVTEIQVRIIVRGRAAGGSQRQYRFTYHMETLVKTTTSPEWSEMPLTPERTKYARDIGQELRTLFEMSRG
mgnify:CR=1 FL=1